MTLTQPQRTEAGAVAGSASIARREVDIAGRLASLVGADHLLAAGPNQAYIVGDQTPTFVARPGTVEEIAALLRCAGELNLAVSAWGGGAQHHLGNPLSGLDLVISLERLNRVLEHYPADLTAAIQAGCSLQAANEALAEAGQMLPLDAPLAAQTTLGGIVAAGPPAAGLRRLAYGTVRDMLLGIQVVRADGRLIRRGGLVVKNVAGYDLARLQYGALGTLGIITQVNLKLQPRPEDSGAILANFARRQQAGQVIDQLLSSRLQPATVALFDAGLAAQLKLDQGQPAWLLVRYDGRIAAVERQLRDTQAWLGAAQAHDIVIWDRARLSQQWPALVDFAQLARIEAGQALLRINVLPAEIIGALDQMAGLADAYGLAAKTLGDAANGIIWLRLKADPDQMATALPKLQQQLLQQWPQTIIAACSPRLKHQLNIWGRPPQAAGLMQTIKTRFDPNNLLNPGRYVI